MPRCKNYDGFYYTGKEPSPRGLGYHAQGEALGTQMMGSDGNPWQVQNFKNGKRWYKITNNTMIQNPTTWMTLNHVYSAKIPQFHQTISRLREFLQDLEFGFLQNPQSPYSQKSWSFFTMEVCSIQTHMVDFVIEFKTVKNQMDIPYNPQTFEDFIRNIIISWQNHLLNTKT